METGPLARVEVTGARLRVEAVLVRDAVDDTPRQQAIERRLRVKRAAQERLVAAGLRLWDERLRPLPTSNARPRPI